MTEIEKLVKQYLDYLELQRHRSAKTIENYQRYLGRFLTWAKIEKPEQINVDLVNNFQGYLGGVVVGTGRRSVSPEQAPGLKQATQYYHLIALHGFLKYLANQDIVSLGPDQIQLGQAPKRQIEILDDQKVERLLNATGAKNLAQRRDRAILETLFSTGLRVGELCALNRDDFEGGQLLVGTKRRLVPTKNSQGRLVYLSDPAKKALLAYLSQRQDQESALFVNAGRGKKQNQASRLTARSIQRIVKKYALLAGVGPNKVTPTALRHAFASGLLRAGAEIKALQRLLGHAHLSTTQVYTKLSSADKNLKSNGTIDDS